MRKILFLILAAISATLCRGAEKPDSLPPLRPLTSLYTIEVGTSRDFNTYLSPVRQSGTHFGIAATWSRAMAFDPQHFIMDFDAGFSFDLNHNRQHTSSMTGLDLALGWDMLYRLRPLPGLQVAGGAGLELDAGALYLPRNSNNPVAARLSLDLTLNLRADYTLRIGRLPVTFTERMSLPSLGVFFSPQYGQSYYEIYLGDSSGLARFGWWGNHFAITNHLSAQFTVCNIRLSVGYKAQCRSSYVSHINTRLVNHSVTLGIATDWINVTRGLHNTHQREIITATY